MIPNDTIRKMVIPFFLVLSIILSSCSSRAPQLTPSVGGNSDTAAPTPSAAAATLIPSSTPLPATATPAPPPTETPFPTRTATPTLAPRDDFMKGIAFISVWNGQLISPTSDWILQNVVQPLGPTWIRINVLCVQANLQATEINCDKPSVQTIADLENVTRFAHRLGLRVMLDFALQLENEGKIWHGMIGRGYGEAAWAEWFKNYTDKVVVYGQWAEEHQIDAYNVASELEGTTAREKEWRATIAAVRQVYHAPLLFSIGDNPIERVNFWDAVDFIGVHPYNESITHSRTDTLEQMKASWKPVVARWEKLSQKYNRPIVVTEIGYPSLDGIGMDMGNFGKLWDVDLQESADLYQAILDSLWGKAWFHGFFAFGVSSYGNPVEAENVYYTIAYKPAAEVVRQFYGAPPLPPRPADPPVPSEFKNIQVIYDDQMQNGWKIIYPDGDTSRIQLDQQQVALSGAAIRARLNPFQELIFRHNTILPVEFAPYQWLELYLYVPFDAPQPLLLEISLRDMFFMSMPNAVLLPPSRYLEGGRQAMGKWQRVMIPLQALGPLLSEINQLVIQVQWLGPATFYVDQVRLLGN